MRIVLEEGLEAQLGAPPAESGGADRGPGSDGHSPVRRNPEDRLPTVTCVYIPEGIDGVKARPALLNEFNIEISGGLGEIKSTTWRIGLMGYSSQRAECAAVPRNAGARPARSGHEAFHRRGHRGRAGDLRARRTGARRPREITSRFDKPDEHHTLKGQDFPITAR